MEKWGTTRKEDGDHEEDFMSRETLLAAVPSLCSSCCSFRVGKKREREREREEKHHIVPSSSFLINCNSRIPAQEWEKRKKALLSLSIFASVYLVPAVMLLQVLFHALRLRWKISIRKHPHLSTHIHTVLYVSGGWSFSLIINGRLLSLSPSEVSFFVSQFPPRVMQVIIKRERERNEFEMQCTATGGGAAMN